MTDGHHMQHGPMTRGQKLDYEFDEFIQANPHIYKKFRMLAVKLKAKALTGGVPSLSGKSCATRWPWRPTPPSMVRRSITTTPAAWPASSWPKSPKTSRASLNYANSRAMVELLPLCCNTGATDHLALPHWLLACRVTAHRQPTPVGVRCHGLRRYVRRASIPRWNTASRGDERETQETQPSTLVIT